ncbi:DUF6232 family protein [Actinoplanes sp. NPDC049118]|uniref:DUF6232 family protein n=1 Tax=Actinoplanes sp. NPDC049118 TaxID=3155769 RepID=UPI0033C5159D
MRIYYRGPDAFLTDEHFIWNGSERADFVIRDLREVGRIRSVAAGLSTNTVLVVTTALAFFVAGWLMVAPAAAYPLSLVVVAASVATLAVRQRRKVSLWQVQATYRGSRVTIYASSDERVFNQVTRALSRAIEDARSSSAPYRLAA